MKEGKFSKSLVLAASLLVCSFMPASREIFAASKVDFKLLRDYLIVIPIMVNGKGPYEFLLDTGTNTTIIRTEFARQLGLKPIDRMLLTTITGSEVVARSQLKSISVGSKSATNLEVLFSDLREIRSIGPEIDGVLGQNFLSQFNYLIDYRKQRIEFEDESELENALCGDHLPIEQQEAGDLVMVKSLSSGKRGGRLVLDSGVAKLILFGPALGDLALDRDQTNEYLLYAKTDTGSNRVQQGRLRNFRIGNYSLHDLEVVLLTAEDGGEGRIEDGLLPTRLFQKIYFNHRKNFVILNTGC
jgi:predicted aspartyl protease